MTVETQINCKECLGDRHDTCSNEHCLCRSANHGIQIPSLKDGVKVDFDKSIDFKFIKEWNEINDVSFEGKDKIDNVAVQLQRHYSFVTLRKTEEILLYNGKIYDGLQAETVIKEETEKLIPNCTTHDRCEVINKIKAQTYTDIEKFDADPDLITVENGILNLETLEVKPHTPKHLSRVLLPVEYHKPQSDKIEDNLKHTLFWKFLRSSFTVDGFFKKEDFETVLEIIASPIIKRHIDEKAFMFLGRGENGKSVCLRYIQSIIGKDNVSSITLQDIADDKFMRANLDGMSANIFSDLEQNELRKTGMIKAIKFFITELVNSTTSTSVKLNFIFSKSSLCESSKSPIIDSSLVAFFNIV